MDATFAYAARPLVFPPTYACTRCSGGRCKLWREPWSATLLCGACILGDLNADWEKTLRKAEERKRKELAVDVDAWLRAMSCERIIDIDAEGWFVDASKRRFERVSGLSVIKQDLNARIPAVPSFESVERPYWGMPTDQRPLASFPSAAGVAWWRAAPSVVRAPVQKSDSK